jgi:hypothetical protein
MCTLIMAFHDVAQNVFCAQMLDESTKCASLEEKGGTVGKKSEAWGFVVNVSIVVKDGSYVRIQGTGRIRR